LAAAAALRCWAQKNQPRSFGTKIIFSPLFVNSVSFEKGFGKGAPVIFSFS